MTGALAPFSSLVLNKSCLACTPVFTSCDVVGQRIRVDFSPLSFLDSVQNVGQDDLSVAVVDSVVVVAAAVVTDVAEKNVFGRPKSNEPETKVRPKLDQFFDLQQVPDPANDH